MSHKLSHINYRSSLRNCVLDKCCSYHLVFWNSVETLEMRDMDRRHRRITENVYVLSSSGFNSGADISRYVTSKRRHIMNSWKLFLISSSAELTLLKLGPFLTMSDILMDIINAGVNISSGNPASAAIGYAMLFTCFLYPGKMHSNAKFLCT